jgi:hypothetical protein
MFAAMLFAISIVALSQFALYYWRAVLAAVAGQPVSENVLAGLHDLTLDLTPRSGGLGLVRLYYRIVDGMNVVAGKRMPALTAWCDQELTICARYAAVQIEYRLRSNLELAASMRSC